MGLGLGMCLSMSKGSAAIAGFTPLSVPDLKAWYKSDAGLAHPSDYAAQFTAANSEYLSIADNASLSTGDVDFWVAAWVWLDTKTADRGFVSKYGTAGNREYQLYFIQASDRFRFRVTDSGGGVATAVANTLGSPSAGAWYFVLGWHDSVNDTVNIKVNNGAADSVAHATGTVDGTAAFNIGSLIAATPTMDGRIDSVAFGKSPPGGVASIVNALSASLYNSGSGKLYADLTASEKSDWGLVSWWELNEASGTRSDSHGTNHLADNNTVTRAAGVVSGESGDPVSAWQDQGPLGHHLAQATASARPTLVTGVQNGLPVVRGDGVDDFMNVTFGASLPQPHSAYVVYKPISFPGTNPSIIDGTGANGGRMYTSAGASPRTFTTHAGAALTGAGSLAAGTFYTLQALYNGANSTNSINGGAKVTGNAGSAARTGLSVFGITTGQYGNGDVGEVLVYGRELTASEEGAIFAYLRSRWGHY